MSGVPTAPLLAFYGDDFTGSTDALESLARAGLRTALFLAPPTPAQLAAFPGLQAVGVAGLTRALAPDAMEAELRPAFAALRALGPRHVHYKVCSTFDSSPTVGSIGRAIDVGADVFPAPFVPLVVGAPALGRWCAFGNLFARLGIGSTGAIHRLDRHPSISRHPVTPMTEADLRVHLARQTRRRIGLVDFLALERSAPETRAALDAELAAGAQVVLFDVLRAEDLVRIGALLDEQASRESPLFSVGSSSIGTALGAHWTATGSIAPRTVWPAPGAAAPLLVVSGSCSPVTSAQIEWALRNGFAEVALKAAALAADGAGSKGAIRLECGDPSPLLGAGTCPGPSPAMRQVLTHLRAGRSVVVHTSRGAAGPEPIPAGSVGAALGAIARAAVVEAGIRRVVFSGGDSSSYAARAFGVEAVEVIAPLAPGAPLCRVHAPATPVHGLEVNFKGGQVGAPDYFTAVARGSL
jgi:3-oxoisoapionate kinase